MACIELRERQHDVQSQRRGPRLTDAQLVEVLALTKDADSVELKLTVPDPQTLCDGQHFGHRRIGCTDPSGLCFFFDTEIWTSIGTASWYEPAGSRAGEVNSVVKLRPVVPNEDTDELRRSRNLVVEVDAMPGGYVCSASMKGALGTTDVKKVAAGDRPIRKLYSREQRAFFEASAPAGVGSDVGGSRTDHGAQGEVLTRGLQQTAGSRAGSTRTARGSSSFPRSAHRQKVSRSPPSSRHFSPGRE